MKKLKANHQIIAKHCRERLMLYRPALKVGALFQLGYNFHIFVGEEISSEIREWFDSECRPLTAPIELVNEIPVGAIELPPRTDEEFWSASGAFRNAEFARSELLMELPKSFPEFALIRNERTIVVQRDLTEAEFQALKLLYDRVGMPVDVEVTVDPAFLVSLQANRKQPSKKVASGLGFYSPLITSRDIRLQSYSKSTRDLVEEDEEIWIDSRKRIFLDEEFDEPKGLLPQGWKAGESRCLVNVEIGEPQDIRNQLTMYRNVTLILPTEKYFADSLTKLGMTESDLLEIVSLGRMQIAFTNSIQRYPKSFVDKLAQLGHGNILLPRRLACLAIADSRRRFPILFPPFSFQQKHELIRAVTSAANTLPAGPKRDGIVRLIESIRDVWTVMADSLNFQGLGILRTHGLGRMFSSLMNGIPSERDLFVYDTALNVQIAGSLHGHYTPTPFLGGNGTDDEALAQIIAGIYSGVPKADSAPDFNQKANALASGILSIGSSVPVVDFAKSFGGGDIDRFRKVVHDLAAVEKSPEEIRAAIAGFNEEVKNFESREKFLNAWDLAGVVLWAAGSTIFVPPASWTVAIMERLVGPRGSNAVLDSCIDSISSVLTKTHPSSVLVSRMKKKLKATL